MAHRYRHPKTGKKTIPSVTEIIGDCTDKSRALTQWAANQVAEWIRTHAETYGTEGDRYVIHDNELLQATREFRKVSQEALDVGSQVHNMIEDYLTGGRVAIPTDQQVQSGFDAFRSFHDAHSILTFATERAVVGQTQSGLYYGGILDWHCELQEECDDPACDCHSIVGLSMIVDFKTSKAIYPDMAYQIAAYRHASETPDDIGAGAILRLDKESGLPEFKVCKNYLRDIDVFTRMVELFYSRHPRIASAVNA